MQKLLTFLLLFTLSSLPVTAQVFYVNSNLPTVLQADTGRDSTIVFGESLQIGGVEPGLYGYGAQKQFSTESGGTGGDGSFTYEGREYDYKTIGTQTWMIENLAYLPSVSSENTGSDSNPHYYVYDYNGTSVTEAKDKANYGKYGVLYNWEAAKTACSTGWHLPTDEEWKTLEKHLGMSSSDAEGTGSPNSGDVGNKLKSTSEWFDSGNGDNSSGFNAFPGGSRANNGGFYDLGYFAIFWSSSPRKSSRAWYRGLGYTYVGVYRNNFYRRSGLSVRCLQN
jgi:uncharacterized protein (TIGR02145 family)